MFRSWLSEKIDSPSIIAVTGGPAIFVLVITLAIAKEKPSYPITSGLGNDSLMETERPDTELNFNVPPGRMLLAVDAPGTELFTAASKLVRFTATFVPASGVDTSFGLPPKVKLLRMSCSASTR
jgi:hypothetical protein